MGLLGIKCERHQQNSQDNTFACSSESLWPRAVNCFPQLEPFVGACSSYVYDQPTDRLPLLGGYLSNVKDLDKNGSSNGPFATTAWVYLCTDNLV